MADLSLHGKPISSVFELLGSRENDITYSLGWALAHSPVLTNAVLEAVFPRARGLRADAITLQERSDEPGITDIEVLGPHCHVIVEAKRGWLTPTERQLRLYTPRLARKGRRLTALLSMSEATTEYAMMRLPAGLDGARVRHMGWREVARLTRAARAATRSHAEKRLLEELHSYLNRIVAMQNQLSNMVYVVSLGSGAPEWADVSWIDFVERQGVYFHPVGRSGWPKEPPNYIGVRYRGHLRAIYHIDSWKIVDSLEELPGVRAGQRERSPAFIYTLGPPILPAEPVPMGSRIKRAARVWAMLDLLLTCPTISDAMEETKKRLDAQD